MIRAAVLALVLGAQVRRSLVIPGKDIIRTTFPARF